MVSTQQPPGSRNNRCKSDAVAIYAGARVAFVGGAMHLEDYLEFHGPEDIRIKGHRIGLEHIIDRYRDGFSPEQIALDFPGLSLEKVYGAITYYLHNQSEVDASIARLRAWQEEQYQQARANPDSLLQHIRKRLKQQPRL
jgi:uncharacterized protein (DUF433 family)